MVNLWFIVNLGMFLLRVLSSLLLVQTPLDSSFTWLPSLLSPHEFKISRKGVHREEKCFVGSMGHHSHSHGLSSFGTCWSPDPKRGLSYLKGGEFELGIGRELAPPPELGYRGDVHLGNLPPQS